MTLTEFLLARIAEDERANMRRVIPSAVECDCGRGSARIEAVQNSRGMLSMTLSHSLNNGGERYDPATGYVHNVPNGVLTHELLGDEATALLERCPKEPASTLRAAECDAKRRIVGMCNSDHDSSGGSYGDGWDAMGDAVLSLLALPYATHPDYDPRWKV